MKIGILALQGGYQKHIDTLNTLRIEHKLVRLKDDFNEIDALILPGGESTTMIKLIHRYDLFDLIKTFANKKPCFGTCAG